MDNQRFVRPTPKADNIGQTVSAQDANVLQDTVVWLEEAMVASQDEDFRQRVFDVLEHNELINRCWLDLFETAARVDTANSTLIFSTDERAMVIPVGQFSGLYQSNVIAPTGTAAIQHVLGLASTQLPNGCTATFEVSTNGQNFYPLPIDTGTPAKLAAYGTTIRVRVTLTRDDLTKYPQLRGIAVLFEDYNAGRVTIGETLLVPPYNYDKP